MAIVPKEKKASTLLLVIILGILIGSYLNTLIGLIPGDNVVKDFFTFNFISFGFGYPDAALIDLSAIRFQFGFQVKFSLLSVIGVFVSLYILRWYK